MKNTTLLLAIMLSFIFLNAQITGPITFATHDCGTWEQQPDYYTEWETVDTLGSESNYGIRQWVYSEEKEQEQAGNWITAEYNPCGKMNTMVWYQKRICELTGIIQVRKRIREFKYIPKQESEYDKVVKSFKDKQPFFGNMHSGSGATGEALKATGTLIFTNK